MSPPPFGGKHAKEFLAVAASLSSRHEGVWTRCPRDAICQDRVGDNSVTGCNVMPDLTRELLGWYVGNAGTEADVWSTGIVMNHPFPQDERSDQLVMRWVECLHQATCEVD